MRVFLARSCRVYVGSAMLAMLFLSNAIAGDSLPAEPTGDLSLSRAIDAALRRNPELAVSSYELKFSEARIAQAQRRPIPEISLELENFAGSGETKGVEALEATLALSQVIELGDKRAYRVSVAAVNRELSGIDRKAQQMDVLAEVTRRFIDVVLAQQAVTLTTRAHALLEQTHAAITVRVEAARSPLAEQSRAAIALTRANIDQEQAVNNLQSARRALAALWGARSVSFATATADLFVFPEVQSFESLSARLQSNPDFLRFATEARLRDAEIRLAQVQSKSDLTVSVGVRRLEMTSDTALVAGVSMPLPMANRNQGAIREAEFRREQLRVQSSTALLQAEATLFGLYQKMLSARMRVTTLRRDAIPQAEAALAQTQSGYERGRFSYLELAATQQELLSLQAIAVDAAADYHRLIAEIERLTGEPLTHDYLEAPLP